MIYLKFHKIYTECTYAILSTNESYIFYEIGDWININRWLKGV